MASGTGANHGNAPSAQLPGKPYLNVIEPDKVDALEWSITQRTRKLYIAIVDDEPSLREALKGLLGSAGLRAITFGSAEEFLESSPRDQVGCVILDMQLPGMTGLELQRHLATTGHEVPVVFITSQDDRDGHLRAQALRAGALGLFPKPFSDDELLTVIRKALDGP
ncbi:MAG TPA: response regulator [Steroidobacteraceae bacterium]|nr:response regulator [Steroidobacteraceae bacterium]